MTETASELWGNTLFLRKRIWEQLSYIIRLDHQHFIDKKVSVNRYEVLDETAQVILDRLSNRLRELGASLV